MATLAASAAGSSAIEIVRQDAVIGAEIRGVDLSRPLDPQTFAEIEAAYNEHTVLLFRNQRLMPEQHIAFARGFGPLEIHVLKKYLLVGYPEILLISNIVKDDGEFLGLPDAGQTWHTDTSYRSKPSRGSILYAIEIPHDDNGNAIGDTLFAGTAPAYDDLPATTKQRLQGLKAVHSYGQRKRPPGSKRNTMFKAEIESVPDVSHPVVRTHPYTGRKALYVFEGECVGIEGMPNDEARTLIAELTQHCIQPKFIYRHKWQVGDVVMWDNAAALHLAVADYKVPQRRLLHRVTIEGGVPV